MDTPDGSQNKLLKRFAKAKQDRANWEPLFQDCFDYALPARDGFKAETPGQKRTDQIFDETAVVGAQEFASRIQSGIMPIYTRWCNLMSGSEVPEDDKERVNEGLERIRDLMFEVLQASNFNQEAHETLHDLAVGTGCLLVEEGDALQPVKFSAIPLNQIFLEEGPFGDVSAVFRPRKVEPESVGIIWRGAKLPKDAYDHAQGGNDQKVCLIEIVERDYDRLDAEVTHHRVIMEKDGTEIYSATFEGKGSCPMVVYRWSKCAGERYGRGPLINAMPAIKTCNLTVQLILENAEMAIAGMWQMDDDGDLNTDNVKLVPGTVLPVAPDSRGMQPLTPGGRFDVAQIILEEMRTNIRKALFNEQLGNPNKTPMTATEVAERMADLARQIGSAFGRLQAELINPVVYRVLYILKKRGLIELPKIGDRFVKIVPTSPLSQAQNHQDVLSLDRALEMVGVRFGPQAVNMIFKQEDCGNYISDKMGVPQTLVRTGIEIKHLAERIAQMAAQAQPQGGV